MLYHSELTTCSHTVFYIVRVSSCFYFFFFLMIRRPPRSTLDRSSAASDVYKRQEYICKILKNYFMKVKTVSYAVLGQLAFRPWAAYELIKEMKRNFHYFFPCLLYTSPSPRDRTRSRMPSSA